MAKSDKLIPGSQALAPQAVSEPRRATPLAWLVHTVAAFLLAYPALGGQLLLNPRSDQYIAGYAFREFARSHFAQYGSVPQWNPYLYGGMPFVDAMHGDTFYPTALLRLLMGTGPGMTWGLIIHIVLAGVFAHHFLRSIGLSFVAALVGGVAYQLGGNIAGLVSPGHDGKLFIAALLPLALLLLTRGVRDGRRWAWGPLALVVGLAVLSPHPQLLQYMLLVCGAWALFLALGWGTEGSTERRLGVRRLGVALGAIAIGMLMGAIQFWPVKTYAGWSPRAGGIGYEGAVSFSLPPEEIINFALPQFSGILDDYWGRNFLHFHSDYVGVTVLILGVLGFGAWATGASRRVQWFFVGTLVIALLWAMGGYTPFYQIPYALVPGTKFFRAPSTMLFVVAFCFAVLAAMGAERLLRGEFKRTALVAVCLVLAFLGVFALLGLLTNSALSIADQRLADRVIANEPALKAGALRMLMFAALAAVVAWGVAGRQLSRDLGGALLVAVVAADLWSVVRTYFQFSPPAAQLYAADAAIEYLQKQKAPFRVAQVGPTQGNIRDVNLRYDGLMSFGLSAVQGYHGNHIARYDLLTGEGTPPAQLANPNFWRLANAQYFLTDIAEFPIDSVTRVVGPVKNSAGNDVYVYRIPGDQSYAWVTPAFVTQADDNVAAQTVLDPRFDVRRAAVFAPAPGIEGTSVSALPEALPIAAAVTAWRPGAATIQLNAPAPKGAALVVSENFYPGWQATVDGKPAPLGRANVSLLGVVLPEGARTIELTFVNAPYVTGRLVTWLAVAAALLLWAFGVVATRREPARA